MKTLNEHLCDCLRDVCSVADYYTNRAVIVGSIPVETLEIRRGYDAYKRRQAIYRSGRGANSYKPVQQSSLVQTPFKVLGALLK